MKRRIRTWGPSLLLISPSLIALGWFVYYFMAWNVRMSLSSWQGLNPTNDFVGLRIYRDLFDNERFQIDLRNILVFTGVFVVGSLGVLAALTARPAGTMPNVVSIMGAMPRTATFSAPPRPTS